jgi:hypothetical protein
VCELEDLARRELELKKTLPFGEWLRHIKDSHEQLCRLVLAGGKIDRSLQVEIIFNGPDGYGKRVVTFKIASDCETVLVDAEALSVRGFRENTDQDGLEQINGELLSDQIIVLLAGNRVVP